MIESRRTFLRACIAGTGMILVPKYADAFRWKARPSGVLAPNAADGSLVWQMNPTLVWPQGIIGAVETTTVHGLSGSTVWQMNPNGSGVLWSRWQGAWMQVGGIEVVTYPINAPI